MANRVFLIGNLTKDVEISSTPEGVKVAKFDIAVARRFKSDEADFFHIVVWRGQAENCEKFLSKGKKVAIIGSLQTRTYEARDGSKRNVVEVVAEEVEFLTPKDKQVTSKLPASYQQVSPVEDDEQLPF